MQLKASGALIVAVVLLTSLGFPHQAASPQDNCGVIEDALQETGKLKPGMTRDKVEGNFVLDGGLNFVMTSRYSFKKCRSIKVDVEFTDRRGGSPKEFSATDKVVKVSQPYLQLPVFD